MYVSRVSLCHSLFFFLLPFCFPLSFFHFVLELFERKTHAPFACLFSLMESEPALIGPTTSLVKMFRERKVGANSMSIVRWKYPATSYFGDIRGKTVTIYSNFYLTDQFESNSLTLVNSSRQFNPHRKPKVSQLFIKICNACETRRLLCTDYSLYVNLYNKSIQTCVIDILVIVCK